MTNLATRWHYLHQLQIGPPSGTTCIGSKVVHQAMGQLASLATRLVGGSQKCHGLSFRHPMGPQVYLVPIKIGKFDIVLRMVKYAIITLKGFFTEQFLN